MKNSRAQVAPVPMAVDRRAAAALADYCSLAKPRLNLLVVATSAAGYYLGAPGAPAMGSMAAAVAGTALVAGGAAALNQVFERDTDRLMRRTRMRPLPDGRIAVEDARMFGLVLSALGIATLALQANVLAALLALATLVVYVAIYTPMKRRSALSTLVGAVPGALPALIGWAAARNATTVSGWVLFAIVFLWQIPHFMAIAWMYRDDYAAAGFPMLPVIEPDGARSGRQAVLYAAALLPVSLMPAVLGVSSLAFLWVALPLGLALVGLAVRFATRRTDTAARALFFGTIIYLPLLWAAMVLTH